ncbi:TPA: DHA2 family efflux MFS transporter permease subunit [Burkholderia multivorans]|uniref:DHA2 family efflux MFS transporter permease subunit n=1 Tax=Burkholderia multivorans TaxID=87883 RepID=UPI001C230EB4|nr:DHA2 family efflux MFS transporter permease subunit [Burkholderia multivorans]MBU9352226.1 DHA2 family efflux MFS transporter permease subunit [Burkholderia multivorans]MBU9398049.1 DHA2 family efflux MFS transporter permease subunit [Burkholderia multivorans]HDR9834311.1 DHA2 family efflux MFS transporter permease subunit [Burkholderia multivorans]HDR9840332.1 DHA2 family efflux MFS transporter permease subunit [Burkholderia multivorans]HDR9849311.1 DHA2 family efflux MFS transporter perme
MTARSASGDRTTDFLPYLVAATFFMEYLDTTVIATALPQMAHTFGVGPNALSLGMTAYMLALAVFIPISGWIADRYGSRTVFGSAIVVFTGASILCGLSNGVGTFTAARLLQGVGGAMMVPVGRMIVVRSTEKSRLMRAIATITWPGIVAPVVGPPIGGFITTYASWRWIFLLNVPFGIAALVSTWLIVRNTRAEQQRPLDWIGFILAGGALTCLLLGTETAGQQNARFAQAGMLVGASVLFGIAAWAYARRCAHPLLDFTTLKVPTFSVTVITGSITRIAINAVPYLLPLLFQIGFGLSPFQSGLLLLASALGNLGMKAGTSWILDRFGFRRVALVDVTIVGICTIACGWLTVSTPLAITLLVVFIYGLTRSMQFTTLATLAYADIPTQQTSAASTLWSAAQQMTIGMGIAFGALSLRVAASLRGDTGGVHYLLEDFRWAFVAAGVLALLTLPGYARLARDAGDRLRASAARG